MRPSHQSIAGPTGKEEHFLDALIRCEELRCIGIWNNQGKILVVHEKIHIAKLAKNIIAPFSQQLLPLLRKARQDGVEVCLPPGTPSENP